MNIEKLYTISNIILGDFSKGGISGNLQKMVTHLQNSINQPNQPQHQQSLSKAKIALSQSLKGVESNKFNIIDDSAVEELGLEGYLGEVLLDKIENIFTSNEITPSVALEELNKLNSNIVAKIAGLTKIQQGFNELELSRLEDNEKFNLVVRIPRQLIDNNLSGFAESVGSLNANLLVFSEIATGTRESFQIGSLSTTDPTLVLSMVWDVGMLMLDILSKVGGIYAGVVLLKQQRQNLIDSGAPEDKLTDFTDWINNQVKDQINEEIPILVEKYHAVEDKARRNELKTEARRKALRIAENIDQGYTFDIKKPDKLDDDEVSEAVEEALLMLNSNNRKIEETKSIGNSILLLPDNDDEL